MDEAIDVIAPERAKTLAGLFRIRLERSPEALAYRQFDAASSQWNSCTWRQIGEAVARWQAALQKEDLRPGDRTAIMLRNCLEWIVFDQACLGLGLVTVPLYMDDRPENIAYILQDAGVKLLFVGGHAQCRRLAGVMEDLQTVQRIVSLQSLDDRDLAMDGRLRNMDAWLPEGQHALQTHDAEPDSLATIVYTSGTTGRPKGVMLSHWNILFDAHAAQSCAPMGPEDLFLSFLPLSHTLERTAGCYLPMLVGAQVAFARSVQGLAEDLLNLKPTVLISVPRIYERIHGRIDSGLKDKSAMAQFLFRTTLSVGWHRFEHQQGRAAWHPRLLLWPLCQRLVAGKVTDRLGGRLRIAVCGGAPLPPPIARFFIGLGLPVYHGFGMTEASPVVSVNRPGDNVPASVGTVLPGVEVRIGDNDELLIRGPTVMQGYWNNPEATAAVIDAQGWLHSGDKARIDEHGRIFIIGRIKEILVLGNGEKVPPADMEMAITLDPLFEQALVLGEGRPCLSALLVLNPEEWKKLATQHQIDPEDPRALDSPQVEKLLRQRVAQHMDPFPGYAQVRHVSAVLEAWDIENGLLTPTLKLKRAEILARHQDRVDAMYARMEH